MTQTYQDGMAIVLNKGKPYVFFTMTCNHSWIEITSKLGLHKTPQDRPDLLKIICLGFIYVEICSIIIKSIKYLYKCVYKGLDQVAMEVHRGTSMDEIQQYVDARWIYALAALFVNEHILLSFDEVKVIHIRLR